MYILETIYGDYDITYQTDINENIIPILILLGILGVLIIIFFISMMRIHKKANRSGISALVPFYNCAVLMEIINEPKWKVLLLIIPGVNIVCFCKAMYRLAKYFRKGEGFCVLTAIFPLFLIPVIAFSNSEYIGINEEAMRGVSVAKDIPVETNKKPDISRPDQPLKERTKVKMSIGGGAYQKEYRDSLLEAKNIKETDKPKVADFRVEQGESMDTNQNTSPNEMNLIQNVAFVETSNNMNSGPNIREEVEATPSALTIELPQIEVSQMSNGVVSVTSPGVTPSPIENATVSLNGVVDNPVAPLVLETGLGGNTLSNTPPIEISGSPINISPVEMGGNHVNNLLASNSVEVQTPNLNLVSLEASTVTQESKPDLLGSPNTQTNQEVATAPAVAEEFINCPHCGAKIRSGSTKCFMCGNEL